MPPESPPGSGGGAPRQGAHHTIDISAYQATDTAHVTARSVDWWAVNEYVSSTLGRIGTWPMAGSVEWRALPDGDPAKTAALLDAARHWALRVETCQQARAQASRDVSAAADWSAVARANLQRAQAITYGAYIPRGRHD